MNTQPPPQQPPQQGQQQQPPAGAPSGQPARAPAQNDGHIQEVGLDATADRNPNVEPIQRVDGRMAKLILAVGGGLFVLMLLIGMISLPGGGKIEEEDGKGSPYDLLQRKVDNAFTMQDGNNPDAAATAQPQTGGVQMQAPQQQQQQQQQQPPQENGGLLPRQPQAQQQSAEPQDPAEAQMQEMQQQQDMQNRREEMIQQQREAVPSVLPESPPSPVPLGGAGY